MGDEPAERLSARQLSQQISAAIEEALEVTSADEVVPATDLIRSQPSMDPDMALDVVEMVARSMQGLTSSLEARGHTAKALTLVDATLDVLMALRSRVPPADQDAFDTLLQPRQQLRTALAQRLEAGAVPPAFPQVPIAPPSSSVPPGRVRREASRPVPPSSPARGFGPRSRRDPRDPPREGPPRIERGLS